MFCVGALNVPGWWVGWVGGFITIIMSLPIPVEVGLGCDNLMISMYQGVILINCLGIIVWIHIKYSRKIGEGQSGRFPDFTVYFKGS